MAVFISFTTSSFTTTGNNLGSRICGKLSCVVCRYLSMGICK